MLQYYALLLTKFSFNKTMIVLRHPWQDRSGLKLSKLVHKSKNKNNSNKLELEDFHFI